MGALLDTIEKNTNATMGELESDVAILVVAGVPINELSFSIERGVVSLYRKKTRLRDYL